MYQAAIVDDELDILNSTKAMLADEFTKANTAVAFDFFTDSEDFLSMFESHFNYDIIFLDIEMPNIDGISVCRKIRQLSKDALVIFISNKEELVFQTFEVQPFRFIRKSELKELCPSLVDFIINELKRRSPQTFTIIENNGGDVLSFDARNIIYVEAQRKECKIVTTIGDSTVKMKLMDLEEKLGSFHFVRIHRSFLVNMDYIFRITKNSIILTSGEELPISRGSSDTLKQLFINYSMS
ncbi:two component transcriptional regulator, LytTR family [Pseudobutyrivibrio sp. OR37]|uniref:LytR/AlgR family response regulator transcription factor n=1 Tax=Pseudobutyrivibrio sp. OR37 TaxID=1798186 RepID=UPI0008EA6A80|nr:LytTR family DNA-binding domain-containing protein [Pseudobutyrivibrio sp. OR37]SFI35342.1 two component transcriptional regulator, LytTR family [Pseudobutyrivibrio sp. OR37]